MRACATLAALSVLAAPVLGGCRQRAPDDPSHVSAKQVAGMATTPALTPSATSALPQTAPPNVTEVRDAMRVYFRASNFRSRGDQLAVQPCWADVNANPLPPQRALAGARVLEVHETTAEPADTMSPPTRGAFVVVAELATVGELSLIGTPTTIHVARHVRVDTVRLTLRRVVPHSPPRTNAQWVLCSASDSVRAHRLAGEAFFRAADSTSWGDGGTPLVWEPPTLSWTGLRTLADSVAWATLSRVASSSASSGEGRSPAAAAFDFEARVGVVQSARDGSTCLTIANPRLAPGTPLVLVGTGHSPGVVDSGRVAEPRERPCTEPQDSWGSVSIEGGVFYTIVLPPGGGAANASIAVVGPLPRLSARDSAMVGDIDGDGRAERFGECTSHEGVHLTITTASVSGAVQRWHAYFYVPYDLEPTCPGVKPWGK